MNSSIGIVGVCSVALLLAGAASAQLPAGEQKCIDGYNNKLRLVSQQAGKSARLCIKNAAKGDVTNADACITGDADGKIAAKRQKVADLYLLGKCNGGEPIQQGADGEVGSDAHQQAIERLARDLFGNPVGGVVQPGKDAAKCQDKAIQRTTQAFTELVKSHRACAKAGMQAGLITDETSLTLRCRTLAAIDTAGKVGAKLEKISADVNAACDAVDLATALAGLSPVCRASTAAAGNCLRARSICRACRAINGADGTFLDCDVLDDAIANTSCPL
jgi:hypothetical protein